MEPLNRAERKLRIQGVIVEPFPICQWCCVLSHLSGHRKEIPDRSRESRCLTNEDTMAPAMGMSETSLEEYTEKMRGR